MHRCLMQTLNVITQNKPSRMKRHDIYLLHCAPAFWPMFRCYLTVWQADLLHTVTIKRTSQNFYTVYTLVITDYDKDLNVNWSMTEKWLNGTALHGASPAIWDHICHPIWMKVPHHNSSHIGWYSIYLHWREGWVNLSVTYGLPEYLIVTTW